MSKKTQIIVAVLIIILAAASRLVAHPWNFTPIAAMSLFAGAYLGKKWGVVLPLAAMFLGDIFIGFYDWPVMVSVYLALVLAFGLGWLLRGQKRWYGVLGAAITSSAIFFVVTNFAVWVFFSWYPHTWAGLVSCFTLALPFFKNTLAGDIIYTGLFFGLYELILFTASKKTLAEVKSSSND